jgi:hypothetical protein
MELGDRRGKRSRTSLGTRLVVLTPLSLLAVMAAPRSHAQGYAPRSGLGLVVEAVGEFGGDNVAQVTYTNGSTQNIKAGQGLTLALGLHFRPPGLPLDFAGTVGYKFVTTADTNSSLGIDRVVIKLTGTLQLPLSFYVDAGPVWHTDTKVHGGGYFDDIHFNDAAGVTVGAGWRWVGVSYTHITYTSAQTTSVDGSSVGLDFTFKF